MAFADSASGLYGVLGMGIPVRVKVKAGTSIRKGQLVGYNSGWVPADDSDGRVAKYVALNDGEAGEWINVTPTAVVTGVTEATTDNTVYLDEDGGYADSPGATTGQIVGRFLDDTTMYIELRPWSDIGNAQIANDAKIAWAKMAKLDSNKLVAGVGDTATVCAVAGDLTLSASGTNATFSVAAATLSGKHAAPYAAGDATPGLPVLYRVDVADEAGDTDITLAYKTRVVDFWIVNKGAAAHAADDKVQLKNGSGEAISDAVAKTASVSAVKRCATLDATKVEVAVGGKLRISATKDTNVACDAYILGVIVA